jgi:hypothetical protein
MTSRPHGSNSANTAISLCDEALSLYRGQAGSEYDIATVLETPATSLLHLDDREAAQRWLTEAVSILTNLGDPHAQTLRGQLPSPSSRPLTPPRLTVHRVASAAPPVQGRGQQVVRRQRRDTSDQAHHRVRDQQSSDPAQGHKLTFTGPTLASETSEDEHWARVVPIRPKPPVPGGRPDGSTNRHVG